MSHRIHRFIRQTAVWVTILVICFSSIAKPFFAIPAQAAYHQAYIQTTIDVSNWDILGGVVDNKTSSWPMSAPLEYSRVGGEVLSSLANENTPSASAGHIDADPNGGGGDKEKNLVLTFPGASKSESLFTHTSSTDRDSARAGLILNSLLFDLNAAFKFVYGDASGSYTPAGDTLDAKIEQYRNDMKAFLSSIPSGSVNGASISNSSGDINSFVDSTVTASDYVTITKNGESRTFQFRMLKGYVNVPANANLGLITLSSSEDTTYIHWGHLAVEAFLNYNSEEKYQVTPDSVYNSTPGAAETILSGMLGGLCDFIANALGLWDFDQLIFNAGSRGSAGYVGGIFPSTWQPLIWTFFFIAELAAVGVLLYSIIVNVGRKALSTVNPIARASAISQIESLFFVAIALGLLPLVIQLSIGISSNLTGIFKDALGGATAADRFAILTSGSGSLGAVITRIIYLGAVIYFNFFYGIRALTIAFLIITGPIFISFVGVSEKKRMLAETWAWEFAANLFIQPLQAMMMSFILLLPSTGRTFDAIVLSYAMIPLTHMIRGLFFGSAGSFAHQLADKGRAGTMRQLGKAGTAAVATAGGAVLGGAGALYGALGSGGGDAGRSGNGGEPSPSPSPSTDAPKNQREFNDKREAQQNGNQQQEQQREQNDPKTTAQQAANSSTRDTVPVSAGTDTDSSTSSNSIVAGIQNGRKAEEAENNKDALHQQEGGKENPPADRGGSDKQKSSPGATAKGIGLTAAAVGLGALGGAATQFNRRVFGISPGPGGGVITQISRSKAQAANRALHPSEKNTSDSSGIMDGSQANGSQVPSGEPNGSQSGSGSGANTQSDGNNRPADAYLPSSEDYEGSNLDANNAYEAGFAEKDVKENGTTEYQIPKENLGQSGVRISSDKAAGTTKLSYDLNKMSSSDANRARELAALYEHGTEEEKQALYDAGIESVHYKTKMENGQEVVSGVEVTARPEEFKENFGIDTKPASMGGRGLSVSTDNPQAAPNLVPDATQYLNNSMARSFSQSVQSFGGTVVPDSTSGTTQVSIPTTQFKSFTEKYPSLDTNSATQSGDMTTFSVPSSTLLEGSSPQSPTLRTINQNRFGGAAPVQVPPVTAPMPAGGTPIPPPVDPPVPSAGPSPEAAPVPVGGVPVSPPINATAPTGSTPGFTSDPPVGERSPVSGPGSRNIPPVPGSEMPPISGENGQNSDNPQRRPGRA